MNSTIINNIHLEESKNNESEVEQMRLKDITVNIKLQQKSIDSESTIEVIKQKQEEPINIKLEEEPIINKVPVPVPMPMPTNIKRECLDRSNSEELSIKILKDNNGRRNRVTDLGSALIHNQSSFAGISQATFETIQTKDRKHRITPKSVIDQASYSETSNGLKVAIMHALYPRSTLRVEEMNKIKSSLLQKIDHIEYGGPYPQFTDHLQVSAGWLEITCNNKETKDWIFKIGKSLKPWLGADLKVVDGENMPKTIICQAFVPLSPAEMLTGEKFLLRLRKQNPCLNTALWRIIKVIADNGGQTFTFAIDGASVVALENINYRPYLNFSTIHIRNMDHVQQSEIVVPKYETGI